MIPFVSLDFYIFSTVFSLSVLILKDKLRAFINYDVLLFSVTIAFMICLPQPLYSFLLLFYCYALYLTYCRLDRAKWFFIGLAAMPILALKLNIIAIIGVSYIIFRVVQIMLDKDRFKEINIFYFTVFVMFPYTLLSGPIDRSDRFVENLKKGYDNVTIADAKVGARQILTGLVYKYSIAFFLNYFLLSNILPFQARPNIIFRIVDASAYAAYLFFDFAGYSLMAIGFSRIIGISLPMNFEKPFLALNPKEFWRRFHITLGSWLNDYVFKPLYLAFSRRRFFRAHPLLGQNIALFLTFLVMGVWNGFKLHLILSGAVFGLYQAIHNSWIYGMKKYGKEPFSAFPKWSRTAVKWILQTSAVIFSLYIFSGRWFS
ncbi:MAG: hypothetical protein LWW91_07680 [Bacteroidales bacterium]|nr:hypothetical protein [Bacteroidales bacterium]